MSIYSQLLSLVSFPLHILYVWFLRGKVVTRGFILGPSGEPWSEPVRVPPRSEDRKVSNLWGDDSLNPCGRVPDIKPPWLFFPQSLVHAVTVIRYYYHQDWSKDLISGSDKAWMKKNRDNKLYLFHNFTSLIYVLTIVSFSSSRLKKSKW